jgi:hypothetical protein
MTNTNGGTAAPKAPDLGPASLVYIEKVRQATRRLKAREPALGGSEADSVRVSLDALREVATFDVEVPTASQRREWEYIKVAIKRLTSWYFRFLAAQLNVFGAHVINLGDTMAAKTEGLQSATDELAVRLGAAEARLRRLEGLSEARTSRARVPAGDNVRPLEDNVRHRAGESPERKAPHQKGPEHKGPEQKGPEHKGPEHKGPEHKGNA